MAMFGCYCWSTVVLAIMNCEKRVHTGCNKFQMIDSLLLYASLVWHFASSKMLTTPLTFKEIHIIAVAADTQKCFNARTRANSFFPHASSLLLKCGISSKGVLP